ncbi:hypothetical protein LshimejAT787_1501800 [Lyophyllum shimeji]|uniref:DUF6532 domain-containing protein n=1 Tax=Lyophyllum shimeji TaxID=47721 RepID=A0A9P3PZK2_LYOSH|nr:hypothetical protein LshimejAT787_1501800 [Lyophyllum shimeji]
MFWNHSAYNRKLQLPLLFVFVKTPSTTALRFLLAADGLKHGNILPPRSTRLCLLWKLLNVSYPSAHVFFVRHFFHKRGTEFEEAAGTECEDVLEALSVGSSSKLGSRQEIDEHACSSPKQMENHSCRRSHKLVSPPSRPKEEEEEPTVPLDAPSSKSRQRKPTLKQQQNELDKSNKMAAAKKKAFVAALRAQQAGEEAAGFARLPDPMAVHDNGGDGPESEEEYLPEHDNSAFSSYTVAPPYKTSVRNGHTLVHRVPPEKENDSSEASTQSASAVPRARPLVRRVTGHAVHSTPLMDQATTGLREPDQDRMTPRRLDRPPAPGPRPYTPHVQEHFSRRLGTYYSRPLNSHCRVPDADVSDDEFGSGHSAGVHFAEPRHLSYPDAHPEFEDVSTFAVAAEELERSRSPPPKTLGMRKSPPPSPGPSTTVVVKKAKVENSGSRGRVCARDLDAMSKNCIAGAIAGYRAWNSTQQPYPSTLEDRDKAGELWRVVCTDKGVRIEFDEDILKLITARGAQNRGQLKTIARPIVQSLFGLNTEINERETRAWVEDLLDRGAFLYKDPKARTGLFLPPVLQIIMNKTWWKNKNDEGVVRPEFSDGGRGVPLVTIALVFTVVENCLDEWVTGQHIDVPFSVAAYQSKFEVHLKALLDFEESTRDANIVLRLRKHLLANARKHAKVDDPSRVQGSQLGALDFEAAKKEWEMMVLLDD